MQIRLWKQSNETKHFSLSHVGKRQPTAVKPKEEKYKRELWPNFEIEMLGYSGSGNILKLKDLAASSDGKPVSLSHVLF